jgi:hypothetical protein
MRLVGVSILAAAMLWSSASVQATLAPDSELTGAWHLVSVETIRPNGEIIYPFYGKHPHGLIIYDSAGWMSVQIVSDPRPSVPVGDSRDSFKNAAAAEKAIAAYGYYAYFGTYTVDKAASTVTLQLKEALYPGERGQGFSLHYSIENARLTQVAKFLEMGEEHQRRLIWQRTTADDADAVATREHGAAVIVLTAGTAQIAAPRPNQIGTFRSHG